MLMRSPIRYAVTPDGVHVAYQIYGDGPSDIVIIPGYVSHLDLWSEPPVDQLVRRLASGHRLIILDRRGSGLSDRPTEVTPNAWVVDTLAVLDAVGSTRAMLLGFLCGGSIAAMFAAIHPERTSGLVMWGASPRFVVADGYPFGVDPKAIESFASHVSTEWGAGISMELFAPGFVADADARAFWARYQRVSASPGAAAAFARALAASPCWS